MRSREWAHQLVLKRRIQSSHAFLLTGNVNDYVARSDDGSIFYELSEVLERLFAGHAFLLHYRSGSGLFFAKEEMIGRYRAILQADWAIGPESADDGTGIDTADGTEFEVPMAPAPPKPPIDKAKEAKMILAFPPKLRELYACLPEWKKDIVRNLPTTPERILYLMSEQQQAKLVGGMNTPEGMSASPVPPFEFPKHPLEIWQFISDLLHLTRDDLAQKLPPADQGKFSAPTVVVVHDPELILPGGLTERFTDLEQVVMSALFGLARDSKVGKEGNALILVSGEEGRLPQTLTAPAAGLCLLEVPYPDEAQRLTFLQTLAQRLSSATPEVVGGGAKSDFLLRYPAETKPEWLALGSTAGLRLRDLEIIGRDALAKSVLQFEAQKKKPEAKPVSPVFTVEACWERKHMYLEQASAKQIKVRSPQTRLDWIGGQEGIKAYFREVAEAIRVGDSGRVPKGWLLVGPPGTGKSVLAQAFAELTGFSYAEIDLEFDPFVGMSARNRSRNRRLILALAPVVIFEDEFEGKHLPRGAIFHGDAGVSARLDAMEREFLADDSRRGKVIWVAATNRPDQLEEAMIRPGRFDRIIPVLPPKTAEGWAKVFEAVVRKMRAVEQAPFEWQMPSEILLEIAGHLPPGTTQGHVNEFCYRAWQFSGGQVIGPDELRRGINDFLPRKNSDFQRQIEVALEYANSRSLVPPEYLGADKVPVEEGAPKPAGYIVGAVYTDPPPGLGPPQTPGDDDQGKGGQN